MVSSVRISRDEVSDNVASQAQLTTRLIIAPVR